MRLLYGRLRPAVWSHNTRRWVTSRQRRKGMEPSSTQPSAPQASHVNLVGGSKPRLILPLPADFGSPDRFDSNESSIAMNDLFDPKVHLPSAPADWSDYEAATPLWHHLTALVSVTGRPISTADYMRLALLHPEFGYYTLASTEHDHDDFEDTTIIGAGGDFITAPEVSSVFTECLGIWFQLQWQAAQKPDFCVVECGPGKGTLMMDWLRFLHATGMMKQCREVHLIELSPVLRQQQRTELESLGYDLSFGGRASASSVAVYWHDSLTEYQVLRRQQQTSSLATYLVAQEFLDALPVYQFQKTTEGWRERLVDVAVDAALVDEQENPVSEPFVGHKKPRLRLVIAPEVTPPLRTLLQVDKQGWMEGEDRAAGIGAIIEVNPEGVLFASDVARLIAKEGGAALLIDYGAEGSRDSLRGFAKHEQVHFLSRPGQVDVTADVDFAALAYAVNAVGEGVAAYGPRSQGEFLMTMGLQERVIKAIEDDATTDEQAENLYAAMVRLADPEEMGERYKVLAIANKNESVPAGF